MSIGEEKGGFRGKIIENKCHFGRYSVADIAAERTPPKKYGILAFLSLARRGGAEGNPLQKEPAYATSHASSTRHGARTRPREPDPMALLAAARNVNPWKSSQRTRDSGRPEHMRHGARQILTNRPLSTDFC